MTARFEILATAEDVAAAAAARLCLHAQRGHHVALSGGSTPKRAYALAAARETDWKRSVLWLGDERHVAPDDPLSNHRMVREQLLDRLPEGARPALERVRTEEPLEVAAADYEQRLQAALGARPRLDLALMGLGPDGHTASLFPGRPEALERERLVVAVPTAGMEPRVPRVSMTLSAFDAAREVVFLVAGADKADVVRAVFGDDPDVALPAAHVRPASGHLVVFCDEAAAVRLPQRSGPKTV